MHVPQMDPSERSQVIAALAAIGARRVVEWGAGAATIRIPEAIPTLKQWVSIELDANRAKFITQNLTPLPNKSVTVKVVPPSKPLDLSDARAVKAAERDEEFFRAYVEHPTRVLERTFDAAFIDGAARVLCIREAMRCVRKGGVILVHDAQRSEYVAAMREAARPGLPVFINPWNLGQLAIIPRAS